MTMRLSAVLGALVLSACSVGTGRGEVTGSVVDPICEIDEPAYSLSPDFFGSDIIEDRGAVGETNQKLNIRIQRGSYRESESDGIIFYVDDTNMVSRALLGVPIAVSSDIDSIVQMTVYLNQTCDSGYPRNFWNVPTIFEAQSGTITFDAIYAPDVDHLATEISAHFENVVFADPGQPGRAVTLSGEFSFQHQRGRPAQPFP